jgi:phosphatidylinositol alpha-1,6-mannosyltransferase
MVEAAGLTERVRLLGAVPDTDLPALYNAAMVYLGFSREGRLEAEGFGLSFLEAAACGLPVVAGRGGGTADAVANGITGYLVDTTSVASVAEVVRQVLLDSAHAGTMGGAGRARVEREFAWGRVVRQLEEAAQAFSAWQGPPAGR